MMLLFSSGWPAGSVHQGADLHLLDPGEDGRGMTSHLHPVSCDLNPVNCTLYPPPNLTKYTAVMQHIQTFRYYCILTTAPHMMQCLEPVYQCLVCCCSVQRLPAPCLPVSAPRVRSCPGQTCCSRHVAAHEIHPLHCGKWCGLNPILCFPESK